VIGESELPPEGIDDTNVVLVDDVAYTGRTMRAAMNELSDWGRPKRILFCVLVDRGGRELPIQPDFTGRFVEVGEGQRVEVRVPELDGRLAVELVRKEPEVA
jgi:pyrimidine operon attenuation protein/uracil phosphoribosyltransferase